MIIEDGFFVENKTSQELFLSSANSGFELAQYKVKLDGLDSVEYPIRDRMEAALRIYIAHQKGINISKNEERAEKYSDIFKRLREENERQKQSRDVISPTV